MESMVLAYGRFLGCPLIGLGPFEGSAAASWLTGYVKKLGVLEGVGGGGLSASV